MPLEKVLKQNTANVFKTMMTTDDDGQAYIGSTFLLPSLQMVGLNPTFADVTEMLMLSDISDGKIRQSDFETFVLQLSHTNFNPKLVESCFEKVLQEPPRSQLVHMDVFTDNFQVGDEGLTTDELNFIRVHNANGRDEVEVQRYMTFLGGEKPLQVVARPEKSVRHQAIHDSGASDCTAKSTYATRNSEDSERSSSSPSLKSIPDEDSDSIYDSPDEDLSCAEEVDYVRCCC